jgi:7-cyano-7-deazaguanine reductase
MAEEDTAAMALTKLGNPDAAADGVLEAFDVDDTALEIVLDCSEFTCRCPVTAQPDWATIEIRYRPGPKVVETKSLKLYLETFREVGIFHEHVAKKIRDDLVALLDPESLAVTMRFNRRGGIAVAATSSHTRS